MQIIIKGCRVNLYSDRQLVVILVMSAALFLFSASKVFPGKQGAEKAVFGRKKIVYELRGDVTREGFYYFSREQNIGELMRASGGLRNDMLSAEDFFMKVKSGSRVIFMGGVEIEDMDAQARMNFFLPLPVNLSSEEDLALIPGIGVKTAKAIIDYRDKNNGIRDLQELTSVKGLGKEKLKSLIPYLTAEKLH